MSRYNPKVFTDVDSLSGLNGDLLVQFLKQFPKFFAAHGIHLNNGGLNYEQLRTVLMNPKEEVHNDPETHDLMEALHLITEMSDHGSMEPSSWQQSSKT